MFKESKCLEPLLAKGNQGTALRRNILKFVRHVSNSVSSMSKEQLENIKRTYLFMNHELFARKKTYINLPLNAWKTEKKGVYKINFINKFGSQTLTVTRDKNSQEFRVINYETVNFPPNIEIGEDHIKYLNLSDQIPDCKSVRVFVDIPVLHNQAGLNYCCKFRYINVINLKTGQVRKIDMSTTHKIKKHVYKSDIQQLYTIFKNLDIDRHVYYSGAYSRNLYFINEFNIKTLKSRPLFAIQKPEKFEKDMFHLSIDKHKLLMIQTKSRIYESETKKWKRQRVFSVFRTSTKKVLKRIKIGDFKKKCITQSCFYPENWCVYTLNCKYSHYKIDLIQGKVIDFSVEKARQLKRNNFFFHQYTDT